MKFYTCVCLVLLFRTFLNSPQRRGKEYIQPNTRNELIQKAKFYSVCFTIPVVYKILFRLRIKFRIMFQISFIFCLINIYLYIYIVNGVR